MNTMERLVAATEKLEALRGNGGPWTLAGGSEWIFPIGVTVAPDDGGVTTQQAELIVTLHRTIEAQLEILRAAHHSLIIAPGWADERATQRAAALADAILGDAS